MDCHGSMFKFVKYYAEKPVACMAVNEDGGNDGSCMCRRSLIVKEFG